MDEILQTTNIWLPGTIAMAALVMASGFFSASETALFYLSHDEVRAFRMGSAAERLAARLLANPDRLLSAVLFWNLIINLVYFAVSVMIAQRLSGAEHTVLAGLFGVGSLGGIILLGEVIPKSLAVSSRKRLARLVSLPLTVAVRALDPAAPKLNAITRSLRRAFWQNLPQESFVDAGDLERAVEVSKINAEIVQQETQVIHNVLDMSEIPVEEVMLPRGRYPTLHRPLSRDDLMDFGGSHYIAITPEDSDDVDAVIPASAAARLASESPAALTEEVIIVPWCSNLATTMQSLRDRFARVAAVVNEYGETIGIVTFEDIIDTVLVAQPSRAKRVLQREPVLEVAPGKYHVDGITTLRYLAKRLDIDFVADSDDQVTVAGLLHEELKHIPLVGELCEWNGLTIRVIDVSRKGQVRVVVSRTGSERADRGEI